MVRGLHAVVLQRASLAAAVASEARHREVEVQVCGRRLGQLVGMGREGHLQCRPRERRCRHHAVGDERHAVPRGVCQRAPSHLLAVAHALRLGEGYELPAHRAAVVLDEGTRAAVVVVVPRPASVIVVVCELPGQLQGVSEACEHQRGVVRGDLRPELDRPVGIDGPDLIGHEAEILLRKGTVRHLDNPVSPRRAAFDACGVRGLRDDGVHQLHDIPLRVVDAPAGHGFVAEVVQPLLEPAHVGPVVVVRRGAQSVELRALPRDEDLLPVVFESVEGSLTVVEYGDEPFAAHDRPRGLGLLRHLGRGHPGRQRAHRRLHPRGLHQQLLLHLRVSRAGPGLVRGEQESHLDEIFALFVHRGVVVGYAVDHAHAGPDDGPRGAEEVALLHLFAVTVELPDDAVVGQRGEVVFVEDLDLSARHVEGHHGDVLIDLLHLVEDGFGRVVGKQDSVHAEHPAVGLVPEVPAVCPVAVSGCGVIVV